MFCLGLPWTAVDCREGKILVNQVDFNKIDSFLINNVQIIKNVIFLNKIHAYFYEESENDKNSYLRLNTRKTTILSVLLIKMHLKQKNDLNKKNKCR